MILVDTSVWVDHLRRRDAELFERLDRAEILGHPFVLGELALGILSAGRLILESLRLLPRAKVATDEEVLFFIERHALHGRGVGYVDADVLASASLTDNALLWTRDGRLRRLAENLGVSAELD